MSARCTSLDPTRAMRRFASIAATSMQTAHIEFAETSPRVRRVDDEARDHLPRTARAPAALADASREAAEVVMTDTTVRIAHLSDIHMLASRPSRARARHSF